MTFKVGDVYRKMDGNHGHYHVVYKVDEFIHIFYFFGNWNRGYTNEKFVTFEEDEFKNFVSKHEYLEFDEQFVAKILLLSKKNFSSGLI